MPDFSNIPFLDRVRAILSDLPASERRLAQFTLDFPGDLAGYNASELASLAQVSNATVTRLIRRLGYSNYEAARRQIRSEKQNEFSAPPHLPEQASDSLLNAHLQDSYSKLSNTYRHISNSILLEASLAISKAPQVWVLGLQANYFLAGHFYWHLSKIIPGARLIPGPGQSIAEHLMDIRQQDVAIVFDLQPRSENMPHLLERLEARCTDIVHISDQNYKERPRTRWPLHCQVEPSTAIDNPVAITSLSHLLLSQILKSRGASQYNYRHSPTDTLAELF